MATKNPAPAKLTRSTRSRNGDPKKVIALMLWKARLREPDMYVQITEADIAASTTCVRYLKVEPHVMIKRPEGLPRRTRSRPRQPPRRRRREPARRRSPS
jgi:hypothetical protein